MREEQLISPKWRLTVLPAAHAVLFVVGWLSQSPFGLSPVFCVDLPFSLPLVARDDWKTVVTVGIIGTTWWLLVGTLGWATRNRKISRVTSAVGAAVVLLTCGIGFVAIYGQLSDGSMVHDDRFTVAVMAIYGLACVLLTGGLLSAIGAMLRTLAIEDKP